MPVAPMQDEAARRPTDVRVEALLRGVEQHEALDALLRHRGAGDIERTIDPRDEMLEFSWRDGGDWDAALLEYFVAGQRVAQTVLEVASQWYRGDDAAESWELLDFGGGYGRVTRWFAKALGSHRVTSSDLLPGAVEFGRGVLGVETFPSADRPQDLQYEGTFGVIYVGSLFTHLPRETFDAWLARLLDLLTPGGVLLFSVHGPELVPPELEMPAVGFLFEASSESREIDHAQYGSTWVSEEAVQSRLAAASAVGRLLPRGLCGYQDLVIATRKAGGGRSRSAADRLAAVSVEPGARVEIEHADLVSSQRTGREHGRLVLRLRGWATPGVGGAPVEMLRLLCRQPGQESWAPLGEVSEFAGRREDEAVGELPGWRLEAELPMPLQRSRALVLLEARAGGVDSVVWVGGVDRLLYEVTQRNWLRVRENELQRRLRVYELAEIIELMKRSVFWRLRALWFRFKWALNLTDEDPAGPVLRSGDRRPEDDSWTRIYVADDLPGLRGSQDLRSKRDGEEA